MNTYPMTPEGYRKLKDELHNLKFVEVPQNVKDIEEAREHGDLRENAEYHAAKERQSHLYARIAYLEDRIAKAEVIDPSKIESERVTFGSTVTLENLDTEEQITYQIVGEDEADPAKGRISISAPIAKAMIGKEVDDEFSIKTPKGVLEYAVVSIKYK